LATDGGCTGLGCDQTDVVAGSHLTKSGEDSISD
jgi:hypothetical protein